MASTSIGRYPSIKQKVSVIENFVILIFKKEVRNINIYDLKLCYFGSLGILNNIEYWIEFIEILIEKYHFRKITFDIYGVGKTLKSIEKISNGGLNNLIKLKGNLNKSEVFKLMKSMTFQYVVFYQYLK